MSFSLVARVTLLTRFFTFIKVAAIALKLDTKHTDTKHTVTGRFPHHITPTSSHRPHHTDHIPPEFI